MGVLTLNEAKEVAVACYRFEAGNKIRFWQDFGMWSCLPPGLTFYDIGEAPHGRRILVADGWGVRERYGNGSIFIHPKYLPPPLTDRGRD